ncbi:Coronin-7 [Geodia barretti]|uniref:Coronin n=1 Tax=Geodia barretti TaxID=519541 RepID=A0AA35TII6_GEOBA|nr:Coronin-7 [Geodia barretti]
MEMCELVHCQSSQSNSYYGELWGSLMHREMQQWIAEHRSRDPETTPPESRDPQPHPPPYVPCEGESVLEIVRPRLSSSVTNLVELIHTQGEERCGGEDVEVVTSEHDTEEGAVGEGGSGDCEESSVGDGGSDETDKANVDEAPPTTQQIDLLSERDGGSDHGEQLQSLHRVQGSQRDIQLQTQLNLVAMKSESTLMFYEVPEKSPYLSQDREISAVDTSIIPVGYHVQRKSQSEFHSDLFPDTAGSEPALTADQWCQGQNGKVAKVSLDPKGQPKAASQPKSHSKQNGTKSPEIGPPSEGKSPTPVGKSPTPGGNSPTPVSRSVSEEESRSSSFSPTPKVLNIVRSSKFRHIQGGTLHRSTHIEKLPKLSVAVPGDSNGFQANRDFVAAALDIAGGQIGIFKLTHTGRQDTDEVLMFQNSANIMDFVFDPFNNHRLVVACDDARIRVWKVPEGGRGGTVKEPEFFFIGHQEKPNLLCFHPQASSLLATAGFDCHLFIWDLEERAISLRMDPLPQPLFAMSWSTDGKLLATIARDHVIRIYDPRNSTSPVNEGVGPEGSRGARIVWLNNTRLAMSGFNKSHGFCLSMCLIPQGDNSIIAYEYVEDKEPYLFDVAPFACGSPHQGDNSIIAYEHVEDKEPYLFDVAPFACGSPHQAVSYLPKDLCDVRRVEIARAVRLCKTTVEPIFFKVPRTRTEYFQDDVYPETRVTGRQL